uniref:Uncharacterized protein n=1 Tax=Octopus bimaculoides TaxID=37653 RepID=A0A0L8GBZ4_OCTBM
MCTDAHFKSLLLREFTQKFYKIRRAHFQNREELSNTYYLEYLLKPHLLIYFQFQSYILQDMAYRRFDETMKYSCTFC